MLVADEELVIEPVVIHVSALVVQKPVAIEFVDFHFVSLLVASVIGKTLV